MAPLNLLLTSIPSVTHFWPPSLSPLEYILRSAPPSPPWLSLFNLCALFQQVSLAGGSWGPGVGLGLSLHSAILPLAFPIRKPELSSKLQFLFQDFPFLLTSSISMISLTISVMTLPTSGFWFRLLYQHLHSGFFFFFFLRERDFSHCHRCYSFKLHRFHSGSGLSHLPLFPLYMA